MWKMFWMLPWKIKNLFLFGIFVILINITATMFIPILLSQFLPLLTKSNQINQIILFDKWIVLQNNDQNKLLIDLVWISLVIILLAVISNIISTIVTTWAGEQSSMFYRNLLFKKYQKLSLQDISDLTKESLINRISNDIAQYWDFLISASSALIKAPLFIIIGMIFSLISDVQLSFTVIVIIPLNVAILVFIFLKTSVLIRKNKTNLDLITKNVTETIIGARDIKVYNMQLKQKEKFDISNQKWYKVESKTWKFFSIGNPAFFTLINLLIILIYWIGYKQLLITQDPQLIAKINVFVEFEVIISYGIIIFAQFIGTMTKAKVSAKRYIEVYEKEYINLFVENGINLDNDFSISFENVNFKYFKTAQENSIQNINFFIPNLNTLGIIGPTGSGKSTIANLIVRNMQLQEGTIKIGNFLIDKINTKNLHAKVGIVYQEALLYSGTIKENLLFANDNASEKDIEIALKTACAYDFVYQFPDKLNHKITQRGKNLSGGQKQRLSIARTLLLNPKILILDDSTSALDNITTKNLIENIKKNYNCTTIIISQKINSIKHANEIIVLSEGKIIGKGDHEFLTKNCDWYNQVYLNQLNNN
ncbi:ABC transporter ATP-binding protein [Mycoplasmopsis cricetuli]|uniref:ABC transporter ATP-binding protein n=1 Tax=Mycoplasmopsis cricetuli TaxID=171283 RepID=UPI00046F222B|nr:ABC transporter ATP-binding protein [Mycoplasmopsis cricetuli]